MKVDVAIIGTGPAGGIAACQLAGSGLKVAIFEKEKLPRAKPCGGLMPGSVEQLFDWDITHLIQNRVSSIQYLYNYEHPCLSHRAEASLILVNRAKFDAGLIEHAVRSGKGNLILKQKFHIEKVIEDEQQVVIYAKNHKPVVADFLIAADGVTSKTARCLGLNQHWMNAVSIDAEVQVSNDFFRDMKGHLIFNYFCIPKGYGWLFPKADNIISCGIATWAPMSDFPGAMSEFISKSIPSSCIQKVNTQGYPLPVYSGSHTIATRRVCLAGDAARLVDPVSGEGIRFALISGSTAARTICEVVDHSTPFAEQSSGCGIYQDRIDAELGKWLDFKYRFESIAFLKAPEYFYHRLLTGNHSGVYK